MYFQIKISEALNMNSTLDDFHYTLDFLNSKPFIFREIIFLFN